MHDATGKNPQAKTGPAYHFTSTVQESYDADALQDKILATSITLSLRDLLGASPEMQRRFANLTKTRREYTDKPPVTANLVDMIDEEPCYSDYDRRWVGTMEADDDFEDALWSPEIAESRVQVDYHPDEDDEDDIYRRYAAAIKIHVQPLYAMVTGRFEGKFGNVPVYFMVDTGSELNLITSGLYDQTNLALDLDGTRWSLKGINGNPVQLGDAFETLKYQFLDIDSTTISLFLPEV
ncbi:hypothetical protein FPV67DRAFT_1671894 [Lyophyllum atratum]|nr:hypothetical protein FPV67DRAFT_1671894 [Lyophyllum atratum]